MRRKFRDWVPSTANRAHSTARGLFDTSAVGGQLRLPSSHRLRASPIWVAIVTKGTSPYLGGMASANFKKLPWAGGA